MKKMPLVSVLMTAYNREKYISEAIDSVIASTYQNWELIIVDDLSKDKTVEIAKGYEIKDNRIKVYTNEVNLGDYPNRNKAASYAKGKYLKYVDSDDMIFPETLSSMVNAMEENKTAAMAISSRRNVFLNFNYLLLKPEESYEVHFYVGGLFDNGPTAVILRQDVFKELGGFSGKRNVGDFEFWLKVAAKYTIIEMPPKMVFWRVHQDQEIQLASELYLELTYPIYEMALKSDECPMKTIQKIEILKRLKKSTVIQIIKYSLKKLDILKIFKLLKANNLKLVDIF